MSNKDIKRLSSQITNDPNIILESVEKDLSYFLMNGNLSVKESNFQVGLVASDDLGQPIERPYIEAVYGGAELHLNVDMKTIPPYLNWRIEQKSDIIQRYKEDKGEFVSSRENRALGMLIFFNERGDVAAADAQFITNSMEMDLYSVRDEIDIDIPPNLISEFRWHLEVTWVNWTYKEGTLECTLGAEIVIE